MNTERNRTGGLWRWGMRFVCLGGLLAVLPLVLSLAYIEFVNSFPADQRLEVLVWSKYMQYLPIFQMGATFSVVTGVLLGLFGGYLMMRLPKACYSEPHRSSSSREVCEWSRGEDDTTIFAV